MGKIKIILLLCAVIAVSFWCGNHSRPVKKVTVKEVEVVHHYDTVFSIIPVPQLFFHPVPTKVDTAAILADYYAEKRYQDTISTAHIVAVVSDVVKENKLASRMVTFNYQQPIVKPHALVVSAYWGSHLGSLLAGIKHKNWTYQAGYDLHNKSIVIGLSKEVLRW